jgi:acyl carrier protein
MTDNAVQNQVRAILREQRSVPVDVDTLATGADLYAAGLTSLASVDLMLALEQRFDLNFPDEALSRKTFSSIDSISAVIQRLLSTPST